MPSPLRLLVAVLPWTVACLAQEEVVTEQAVRETVAWLADDARRGRGSGSVELEQTADWLAERFTSAGLTPGCDGSWFHEWTLPGQKLDSNAIQVALVRRVGDKSTPVALEAGRDVRWWRPADATAGVDQPCTVAPIGDPGLQAMLHGKSARRPTVIEVAADDPYWLAADGQHSVYTGVRGASQPVFLVLAGALPAAADGGEASWTVTWSTPEPGDGGMRQRNVVAALPGTTLANEYVIVSAHYDHVGVGSPVGGDSIYNGADDDATGTTAVLLVAAAMAKQPPPKRTVLFVCFSGEEIGLRGSAAFCKQPPVPLERVVANLNIEMIGRPEPGNEGKAWITGPGFSDFTAIVEGPLERAGVLLVDFAAADQLFAQSDNWSLARHGVVAHSLSAGSLHADYHRPGDEVEKLDLPHMTRIVRGLIPAVRELADREGRPAWTDVGRRRIERRRG